MRVLFSLGIMLATTLTTYTQPTSIQTKSASGTSTTTVSVTFTQAPTAGDLELCSAAQNAGSGATFAFPSGFTVTSSGQTNVGTSLGVSRAYHVVSAGDPSTLSLTVSASVGKIIFGCTEYAYVNTASPVMSDACTSSSSPTALFSGPSTQPLAPTVATSLFAATGTLTDTPQGTVFPNFDVSIGTLNARDQHSSPIYNFQQKYIASLLYNVAPTQAIACTTILNPTITPFTVQVVNPVATSTPAPVTTPTPPPFGGVPAHVKTAEYLLSTTEVAANPTAYAPYLTYAYTKSDHELVVHNAGIQVIAYLSALMPQSGQTSQTLIDEYGYATGTYANAMATTCTSATKITDYGGTALVANVLGSYSNGSGTIVNAAPFITADYAHAQTLLSSYNSGSSAVPDLWLEDNGSDSGVSSPPCGDASQTVWANGIANTFSSVTTTGSKSIIINSLGVWTMPWVQAQMNTLNASVISGAVFESCYGGHHWNSTITGDYVSGTDKDWFEAQYAEINTIAKSKLFWCYNKNTIDGASDISARMYMYGSFLLTYNPSYSVYQSANASSPSTFKVFPETGFVGMSPGYVATDISQLKQTSGVYEQDFGTCYYRGSSIGACSVYVNPSPTSTYALPSNNYANSAVLSGDGVLDGGTMTFYGGKPTSLGPTSAVILTNPQPIITSGASPYTLGGVHVYTANDWFTTNLITGGSGYAVNTVDPNSASILSNFSTAKCGGTCTFAINGTTSTVFTNTPVNYATNATPMYTNGNCVYGCFNDSYNDDPAPGASCTSSCTWKMPWTGSFVEQGLCSTGDCHTVVVNTQSGLTYDTYTFSQLSWNGSAFTAKDGAVHNLNHSYNSQLSSGSDAAGVSMVGTFDFGEDINQASINHVLEVSLPGTGGSPVASGGYVTPATQTPNHCASSCSYTLPLGARLRLNSSRYTCPSAVTYPQANKVCVQMETYGIIIVDWNGGSNYYGPNLGGIADVGGSGGLCSSSTCTNPWNESDVSKLNGIPLTDFDVMTLGTIH